MERNPKIDPRPGDVLVSGDNVPSKQRTVANVFENRVWYRRGDASYLRKCSVTTWAKQTRHCKVISRGPDEFTPAPPDFRSPSAKARDEFLSSTEGVRSCDGASLGVPRVQEAYLRNRIELAFAKGWEACEAWHRIG